MKKAIYTLALSASVLFAASSCIGLDTAPYDKVTDLTYWNENEDAALATLNSCYASMYSIYEVIEVEGLSDNAYFKSGDVQLIASGKYSTDNGFVKSTWDHYYTGIRFCNELLTNIDKVPGLSDELKTRYIAECKTIKSIFFYELYTKFGSVPYFDHPISVSESFVVERTPKDEIVAKVIEMLEESIPNLPESYSAGNRGRITAGAAKAVLAKVHLFEGNFAEVAKITDEIMSSGVYALNPSYEGIFDVDNEYNSEVILNVEYAPVLREWSMRDLGFLPPSMGGYCSVAPTQELVDSYIMLNGKGIKEAGSGYNANDPYTNRDPRLAATVIYTGNFYRDFDGQKEYVIDCSSADGRDAYNTTSDVTPTGYYLKKYWDPKYRLTLRSSLNAIIIRYADILLMNAEANAELGSLNEGVWNKTVKAIRERAGFTEASALNFDASANNKEIIRNERRCELAFEGLRHKDIMRWRIAEDVLKGNVHGFYTGAAVGTDNGFIVLENRNFDPAKHYLWPIPQKDRDINGKLTQNPEW